MAPPGDKLTGRQAAALAALLAEPTVQAAAVKAGIGERTLQRWLRDPGFISEFRAARRQLVEGAVARLQRACDRYNHPIGTAGVMTGRPARLFAELTPRGGRAGVSRRE
jgi:hypothetical protein